MYSVKLRILFDLYRVQCTVEDVVRSVQCTVEDIFRSVCTVEDIFRSVCTVEDTVRSVQCTVYSRGYCSICTVYSVQ